MNKKIIKYIIISIIVVLFAVFLILIYKNIFASTNSNRLENIENYKLSNKEKEATETLFKTNDKVNSVKVYTNNKIINIMVELNEDIPFDDIKSYANDSIKNFSEENLSFYDVEIFIKSLDKESKIYPIIGYKFKGNTEFAW